MQAHTLTVKVRWTDVRHIWYLHRPRKTLQLQFPLQWPLNTPVQWQINPYTRCLKSAQFHTFPLAVNLQICSRDQRSSSTPD